MEAVGNGIQLCGKKGGQNFIDTQRVDLESGKCPDGLVLCNPSAAIDNRICRTNFSECPINAFKIFSGANKPNDTIFETYRQLPSNLGWMAWTSKADALPITKFALSEGQPCMDPTEDSITPGR